MDHKHLDTRVVKATKPYKESTLGTRVAFCGVVDIARKNTEINTLIDGCLHQAIKRLVYAFLYRRKCIGFNCIPKTFKW